MLDRALVLAAGAWVDLRARLGQVAPDLYLNLSPAQLVDADDVDRLRHVLVATDLAAPHVVVEITDAASMSRRGGRAVDGPADRVGDPGRARPLRRERHVVGDGCASCR